MECVLIYGPPASGKFTVAGALAEVTGYRLCDNHLTVPVAKAVFPSREPNPDPRYSALVKRLRLAVLDAAAAADVDVITTLAFSGSVDHPFLQEMVATVRQHGGEMRWVQLVAPTEVLMRRVSGASRVRRGKIHDPDRLAAVLAARDLTATVPYPDVLRVDTSVTEPAAAAAEIAAWLTAR